MIVFIRTDANNKIGYGHFSRCLNLAKQLKQNGFDVFFILSNISKGHEHLVESNKFRFYMINSAKMCASNNQFINTKIDAQLTLEIICESADFLLVDSYLIDNFWLKSVKNKSRTKCIIFDDFEKRIHNVADVRISYNISKRNKLQQRNTNLSAFVLDGPNYAPISAEYRKLRNLALLKRKKTKVVNNILVSYGGSDEGNLTLKTLKIIPDSFNITLILGANAKYLKRILNYIKKHNKKNVRILFNVSDMAGAYLNADLAFGACGVSLFERSSLGLPSFLVALENNQKNNYNFFTKNNIARSLDFKKEFQEIEMDSWREMVNKAFDVCDGLGLQRIVKYGFKKI